MTLMCWGWLESWQSKFHHSQQLLHKRSTVIDHPQPPLLSAIRNLPWRRADLHSIWEDSREVDDKGRPLQKETHLVCHKLQSPSASSHSSNNRSEGMQMQLLCPLMFVRVDSICVSFCTNHNHFPHCHHLRHSPSVRGCASRLLAHPSMLSDLMASMSASPLVLGSLVPRLQKNWDRTKTRPHGTANS